MDCADPTSQQYSDYPPVVKGDSEPQDPHGYYYIPLQHGGVWENALEPVGMVVGMYMAFAAGFGGFIGYKISGTIGAWEFKQAGFLIDNISNIESNVSTAWDEVNQAASWLSAQPYDDGQGAQGNYEMP